MRNTTFLISAILTVTQVNTITFADWNPQVYNAIKWTGPNQGQATIAYTTNQGITRIPMAYHGGVDTNASGDISEKNIERFTNWSEERLPSHYCGPVVMDYEHPWWPELGAKELAPNRLEEIQSVYIEGAQVALRVLPNAQWGYWGLPLRRNTTDAWLSQGLSLEPLISQCAAVYPDIYDSNRGQDNSTQAKRHIESVLKEAAGRMPVYAFVSPRFTGEGGDHSYFIPDDIFLRHVNAAMQAVWVDGSGIQHRIQGLILWDAYGYTPESGWEELDKQHVNYFELLQALVTAWKKAMVGVTVEVGLESGSPCQYGLPEPNNSENAIDDAPLQNAGRMHDERIRDVPRIENDRIPSSRVKDDRIQ